MSLWSHDIGKDILSIVWRFSLLKIISHYQNFVTGCKCIATSTKIIFDIICSDIHVIGWYNETQGLLLIIMIIVFIHCKLKYEYHTKLPK